MVNFEIIGFLAGACTSLSFLPQVIKTYKIKETKDISFWMYLVITTGVTLWLIYGFLTKDMPVIIANLVTLILVLIMLIFKIKYK